MILKFKQREEVLRFQRLKYNGIKTDEYINRNHCRIVMMAFKNRGNVAFLHEQEFTTIQSHRHIFFQYLL